MMPIIHTMLMLHSSVFEVKFQVAPILPIPGLTLMGLPNGDLGRCPFCALSDSWALFPSSKSKPPFHHNGSLLQDPFYLHHSFKITSLPIFSHFAPFPAPFPLHIFKYNPPHYFQSPLHLSLKSPLPHISNVPLLQLAETERASWSQRGGSRKTSSSQSSTGFRPTFKYPLDTVHA